MEKRSKKIEIGRKKRERTKKDKTKKQRKEKNYLTFKIRNIQLPSDL